MEKEQKGGLCVNGALSSYGEEGGANYDNYLCWLHIAYEHLKRSKFVYDKKERRLYYNKPYWEWRFKMEIKRVELILLLEQRIRMECDAVM